MNVTEKFQETGQMQKTVEQWLREDVVRICEATTTDPSRCIPLDEALNDTLATLRARRARKSA